MNNRKIRVLHFTISDAKGGITQNILNIWDKIDKNKFEFDFVTMSKSLSYAGYLEAQGCKIYYLSTYAEQDEKKFREEVSAIMKRGYDVVHLHTNHWRGFVLEELAKENNVPRIIIHSHNTGVHIYHTSTREEAEKLHYEKRALLTENMATDFWACSPAAADWLFGNRISQSKVKILKCGIDTQKFLYSEQMREEYKKSFGLENNIVFGHIGRFDVQKNHHFLIDVFSEVAYKNANVRLMLIGDGSLRKDIEEKVRMLKLEEKVLFLGKRTDVNKLLQAMDYFLLPSQFEGLGIVLLEAQASGLKCLASNEVPEEAKVTDNIKFLSLDKDTWVQEMLRLSHEKYIRENQKENIIKSGYDGDSTVRIIEKLYEGESITPT